MRLGRMIVVGGLLAGAAVVLPVQLASAAACTGNTVIQQAPYSCEGSKTFGGQTISAALSIDAVGRATTVFTLSQPAFDDVLIAMHSWIGIDTGPDIVVTGTIPQGQTTTTLVIPQINCGQLDIKAFDITPGHSAGDAAGPYVTWGDNCQQAPTTTTTVAPTSVAPTTTTPVSPTSAVRPTSTLPNTGGDPSGPVLWGALGLVAGALLLLVARRWTADAG